jgi:hypothetical protein
VVCYKLVRIKFIKEMNDMPIKNKKCKWEYCNETCECEDCNYCEHYRPNYKRDKELLEDLRLELQEQR